MTKRPYLPVLRRARFRSLSPLLSRDVDWEIQAGTSVVLGGNGLGKTTLIQAIVYALSGGNTEQFEDAKDHRWDFRYFRGRFDDAGIRHGSVSVTFQLGNSTFVVTRGFANGAVIELEINDAEAEASDYEKLVVDAAGLPNFADFAFLTNRLLYLPESRRLLAWDPAAQVRLMMLLSGAAEREGKFRHQRETLTRLDTEKRHTHVALSKARTRLQTLKKSRPENDSGADGGDSIAKLTATVNALRKTAEQRRSTEVEWQKLRKALSDASQKVDALKSLIEADEAATYASAAQIVEATTALPLARLIEHATCPACGTTAPHLRELALQYQLKHGCTLCGSEAESSRTSAPTSALRAELEAHLVRLRQLQSRALTLEGQTADLRIKEAEIQTKVNEARFDDPILTLLERDLSADVSSPKQVRRLVAQLEVREAELEAQVSESQAELERKYTAFRNATARRVAEIRNAYAQYASDFLGTPCTLAEHPTGDRLFNLPLFVPEFDNSSRPSPLACSEAQRFFLDIAFRLALISSANKVDEGGTFICETPESALDLSYLANVVRMLGKFENAGHSLLLSSNVQISGLAGRLLSRYDRNSRPSRVLNLIELGRLSSVQLQGKSDLDNAIQEYFA